jgi:16S rRNA (uracil1498-N3)-methyltransferase
MRRDHPHHFVFYSPHLDRDAERVELTGDEHHHLRRVVRMSSGDIAFVSNGRGVIVSCVIDSIDGDATRLRVAQIVEDRTADDATILALACLKKEAFEHAVKQCSELGVTRFVPFVAAKSHVKQYSQTYLERLRRIALSAMKQSFRAVLPEIEAPIPFDALLGQAKASRSVVVGDADAQPMTWRSREAPVMIVVGPESGLASEERDAFEAVGCEFGSVSAHRLRSETAAAALTSHILSQTRHG